MRAYPACPGLHRIPGASRIRRWQRNRYYSLEFEGHALAFFPRVQGFEFLTAHALSERRRLIRSAEKSVYPMR